MKITNKQAVEAQQAIMSLLGLDLPVKVSLEIAKLSVNVDKQVAAFTKVRDSLIQNYQIKVSAGDTAGKMVFSTNITGEKEKEVALLEFMSKVNELVDSETDDISGAIHLPDGINIKPEILKPLVQFIEMEK